MTRRFESCKLYFSSVISNTSAHFFAGVSRSYRLQQFSYWDASMKWTMSSGRVVCKVVTESGLLAHIMSAVRSLKLEASGETTLTS